MSLTDKTASAAGKTAGWFEKQFTSFMDGLKGPPADKRFYTAPDIPEDKLANAIAEYAQDVNAEEVLWLLDVSVWGNGKAGVQFTKGTLYASMSVSSLKKPKDAGFKDIFRLS